MSNTLGEGSIRVRADTKNFGAEAKAGILGPLKGIAVAAGGLFAANKVKDFIGSTIDAASDLNESITKTQAVFKGASPAVEAFAKTAATSIGQSRQQALEATATFGNLFRAMGTGPKQAANLSTHLVTLAGDLASFNNVSPQEALEALRSGIVGEVEPLRKFGVNLSQTAIQAKALATGIVQPTKNLAEIKIASQKAELAQSAYTKAVAKHGKTSDEAKRASIALETSQKALEKATKGNVAPLTAQQKATAAYKLIMEQTKLAQGDFQRTSGGLANQQRILSAQFIDAKAKIGTVLLPVIITLVGWVRDAITAFSDAWPQIQATARQVIDLAQQGFAVLNPKIQAAIGIFQSIVEWLGGAKQALKDVAVAVSAGLVIWAGVTVVTAIYSAVTTAIFLVRNAQLALNVAMEANPVGLVVVALAALAVGLYIAYQKSATFREIVNSAFALVKSVAKDALEWISKTGLPALQSAWSAVVPPVTSAISAIVGAIKGLIQGIRENWGTITSIILPPIKTLWSQVTLTFTNAKTVILNIIDGFSNLLHGRWGAAWDNLKAIVSAVFSQLTGTLQNLAATLAETAGKAALAVARAIGNQIKRAPEFLLGLAGDLVGKLGDVLSQAATDSYKAALSLGSSIGDGIKDGLIGAIKRVAAAAKRLALAALGPLKDIPFVSSPSKVTTGYGLEIGAGLAVGMDKSRASVSNSAKALGTSTITSILDGLGSMKGSLSASLQQQVREAVVAGKKNLYSLTSDLASQISAVIDAATAKAIAAIPANLTAAVAGVAAGTSLSEASKKITDDQAARQERNLRQALAGAQAAALALSTADPAAIDDSLTGNDRQKALDKAQADLVASRESANQAAKDAQEDLDDYLLQKQIDFDQATIASATKSAQDAAEISKKNVQQQLADWTYQFNTGVIDQATFLADIQSLAPDYASTGDLLGLAFVGTFKAHLSDLIDQIQQIAQGGIDAGGAGLGQNSAVSSSAPVKTQVAAAQADLKKQLAASAKAQADIEKYRKQVKDLTDKANDKGSPGGTKITKEEQDRIDASQKLLNAANKMDDNADEQAKKDRALIATLLAILAKAEATDPAIAAAIAAGGR